IYIITDVHNIKIHLASYDNVSPRTMDDLVTKQLEVANHQLQGTSTTWLFPSRNPGRHLHPRTLSHDMKKMGINTVPFRGAAIFNLIQTMPLSIVHDLTRSEEHTSELQSRFDLVC